MSAIGTKQTWQSRSLMSALGGKADMVTTHVQGAQILLREAEASDR
jgi:hypothetical protein